MNPNENIRISGTIESVVFHNDENDYTVFEISDKSGSLVTCVGNIPYPSEGENVELVGSWTYHKEYGKQLIVTSFEKHLPKEVDGILRYLTSRTVKGVGPVTALKIVNKFGAETFDVMENHPEWLADIPGITPKKAAVISQSFREQSEMREVMTFCQDLLKPSEIPTVYKAFGSETIGNISNNPWMLCFDVCGLSFPHVEEIAEKLGTRKDHPDRLFYGIRYVLKYNEDTNGHTCLPKDKLLISAQNLLSIPAEQILETYCEHLATGEFAEFETDGVTYVLRGLTNRDETVVAKKIAELNRAVRGYSKADILSMIERAELDASIEYADLQRKALFEAINNGVMILTGGPGTGKTTVVRAMLSIFKKLGQKTVLCAPTGRAAKRLTETTGEEAKTVHRMLEMERNDSSATGIIFGKNEKEPLEESVIIVDEASMLDLSLTAALLRAIKNKSRLILIGDSDQLPSVGAGNVLADLIACPEIVTVKLTEIFRQSEKSMIVRNAHRIHSGEPPILTCTDNDFFFVSRENEATIADTVASLVIDRLPKAYGKTVSKGIQVISPSKKGAGGVEMLNATLQARINPPKPLKKEKAAHGVIFREGDRVMQVSNNYELDWDKNGVAGMGLFNGDIGFIDSINLVEHAMIIIFDGRRVFYPFDQLDDLELAYAITVHKSQGSEYPIVIVPMYQSAPMLMTRNLLYTAITRAKKMVILVGRADIAVKMAQNNREELRYTTLTARISSYSATPED